jgi:hypothetical protein
MDTTITKNNSLAERRELVLHYYLLVLDLLNRSRNICVL